SALMARSAEPVAGESPALKNAVVLIIRHAEKPDSGYDLSPAGYQRADAYPGYFKNLAMDSKPLKLDYVFATADSKGSHRPRLTVEPLGKALGLQIDTRFTNKKFQDMVDEIQTKNHGRHILICWHHGEIPNLVRALGADPDKLLPEGKWPNEVFGWMIQLRFDENGRLIPGETKRVNEKLMPGDLEKQGNPNSAAEKTGASNN
ncbi:MAG TPA: hypothetical protein VMO20_06145, partial [Candidatus Acidoferrum sp.]|nr:hypothetical protein [Candidatus Acidoferrum sp.]